jgi:hypothetical protein
MTRRKIKVLRKWAAVWTMSVAASAAAAEPSAPLAEVRIGDVDLFYRIYDAVNGMPSAEALQKGYVDAGSEGVRQFVPHRIISGEALATAVSRHHADYEGARKCLSALPAVKTRLAGAFHKLAAIDPNAVFPPVTILIGRDNSGGTTGRSGVLIGLEVVCRSTWMQLEPTDRLLHIIAHEYGHVQQFAAGQFGEDSNEDEHPGNVLRQSLTEGGAELIAELISGEVSNVHLQRWTNGHEREIEDAFLAQMDSTDLSAWLYNGPGTPEKPGDLGYWVGYRILKSYYRRAHDKRAALATLLALKDPKAILAESGWHPGDLTPRTTTLSK